MGRDITLCHPELQEKAKLLIDECKKQGLIVKLGECFRSVAEQDELYAQGRTKPGVIVTYAKGESYSSMHQWGVAFDIIRNDGKGVSDTIKNDREGAYYDNDGWFNKVGRIGKSIGLEWGGDWTTPVDKPHFQLPQWGSTPDKLKRLYGNVNNFKKTWSGYKPKEDDEVVSEGKAIVNGKEYKIDRILKDNVNYIKAANFDNMGFNVGYNANLKAIIIDNNINEIDVNAEGKDKKVKAVNINGFNYISVRDLANALGKEIEFKNGKIIIK